MHASCVSTLKLTDPLCFSRFVHKRLGNTPLRLSTFRLLQFRLVYYAFYNFALNVPVRHLVYLKNVTYNVAHIFTVILDFLTNAIRTELNFSHKQTNRATTRTIDIQTNKVTSCNALQHKQSFSSMCKRKCNQGVFPWVRGGTSPWNRFLPPEIFDKNRVFNFFYT